MKSIEHPSHWLDKAYLDKIRERALEAESLKQLHPDQLKLIHQQGWLKMFVPKAWRGLALSLPEVLKIEESLAWADGSTAWVVTLCAGAAWFVGFLDPELAQEIFSKDSVLLAGSGAASGVAEIIPDGYLLNGQWKYASGALHADVFTANCAIHQNGKPVIQSDGTETIRAFVMMKDEVMIHDTWNSMGMIATGSHSFEARNLVVPKNRCFEIDAKKTVIDSVIYHYPFLQLAETTLAVNLSGLALQFIDLSEEMTLQKANGNKSVLKEIQIAKAKMAKSRSQFYQAVDVSWKSLLQKKSIPKTELQSVSKASQALAKLSRQSVSKLYPLLGLTAADVKQEINRVWRNINTAGQHSLFKW